MNPRTVLIPGGTRLRTLHPVDRNGSCEVLYDLERNRLVEVPDLFHFHIALALEKGELDESLLSWLASEDLLTYDHGAAVSDGWRVSFSDLADFFLEEGRGEGSGCVYFADDQAHCRLRRELEHETEGILGCLFGSMDGISRITLHLGNEGAPVDLPWLRGLVERTSELAQRSGKQVGYEIWLSVEGISPAWAKLLAEHSFRVRVHCNGPEGPEPRLPADTERGLQLLWESLGERLTVHAVLGRNRLAHLWRWARQRGLAHLHATPLDLYRGDVAARELALRRFREDLDEVCDDMFLALSAGEAAPLLYEPVVRVVRRLARGLSSAARRTAPRLGVVSHGRVLPVLPSNGREPMGPEAGTVDVAAAGAGGSKGHPCDPCWARALCGRGVCADPALGAGERVGLKGRHCDFWRAETEAAILFFRRLHAEDPSFLLGLASPARADVFDTLETGAGGRAELMTC